MTDRPRLLRDDSGQSVKPGGLSSSAGGTRVYTRPSPETCGGQEDPG